MGIYLNKLGFGFGGFRFGLGFMGHGFGIELRM